MYILVYSVLAYSKLYYLHSIKQRNSSRQAAYYSSYYHSMKYHFQTISDLFLV